MNTRQLTLVVTIAAIALVFVGIGYAYTAYTVNNGNQTEVAYVTVTQGAVDAQDQTPYKFADGTIIQFDTYNETDSNTVYYKVRNAVDVTYGNDKFICAKLGSIKLKAAMSNTTVQAPATLAIGINDSTGFNAVGFWTYVITDADNKLIAYKDTAATAESHGNWTIVKNLEFTYSNNAYADVDVNVYYGYLNSKATKVVGTEKFLDNNSIQIQSDRAPQKLSNASIVFVASDDYTITYNANNGTSNTYTQVAFKGVNGLVDFTTTQFQAPSGQTFKGWALTNDATDVITSLEVTENKTLYAIYE